MQLRSGKFCPECAKDTSLNKNGHSMFKVRFISLGNLTKRCNKIDVMATLITTYSLFTYNCYNHSAYRAEQISFYEEEHLKFHCKKKRQLILVQDWRTLSEI